MRKYLVERLEKLKIKDYEVAEEIEDRRIRPPANRKRKKIRKVKRHEKI